VICQACEAKTQTPLCSHCTNTVRDILDEMPRMLGYLDDTRYGHTRLADPGTRHTRNGTGLNVNPPAARLARDTHLVLANWARTLCRVHNWRYQRPPQKRPQRNNSGFQAYQPNPASSIALWLAQRTDKLALLPDAGDAHRDITWLADRIEKTINRPDPPIHLGPCPAIGPAGRCMAALTARPGQVIAACHTCGAKHAVRELAAEHLRRTQHLQLTAAQILGALELAGEPLSERTWRRWRQYHIRPRAWRHDGEPLYRVGDVYEHRKRQPV